MSCLPINIIPIGHGHNICIMHEITADIPVGIQDFREVRSGGLYYLDNTDLIAHIPDRPGTKVLLYTRLRRFGKSMNLSMLDAFLNIGHKGNSWFDGLKISEGKELEEFKNVYPVLYFDFKKALLKHTVHS